MRRAIICVGFVLAVAQLWPAVFGHGEGEKLAAATRFVPAAHAAVHPAAVSVPIRAKAVPTGLPTCFQRYQRAHAQCGPGNAACQLRTSDSWDVCDATGFWTE